MNSSWKIKTRLKLFIFINGDPPDRLVHQWFFNTVLVTSMSHMSKRDLDEFVPNKKKIFQPQYFTRTTRFDKFAACLVSVL